MDHVFFMAAGAAACALVVIMMLLHLVADPEPLLDDLAQGWANAWQAVTRRRARPAPGPTLEQLLEWDRQWTDVHLAGGTPVWVPGTGWMDQADCVANATAYARQELAAAPFMQGLEPLKPFIEYIAPCVCGYTTECAVHCGDGHTTGRCPGGHAVRRVQQAAGMTGDEFARRIRHALGQPQHDPWLWGED